MMILREMMLEVVIGVQEVGKVADEVTNVEVDKVTKVTEDNQ